MRPRLTFAIVTLGLFLLFGSWAVASPMGSVPDEYQHYKYGYAMWSGQVTRQSTDYSIPTALTLARIECYAFQPTVTPSCDKSDEREDLADVIVVSTVANKYPPLFYALSGWPLLMSPDPVGVYVARAISAAACALIWAWAIALLAARRWHWVGVAALFTVTPMAAFFAGGYNPEGLGLALSALLVCSGLLLLNPAPNERSSRWPLGAFAACAMTLPLVRPLGSAWVLLIAGLLVLASLRLLPIPALRAQLREISTRTLAAMGAAVAVGSAVGAAWQIAFPAPEGTTPLNSGGGTHPEVTLRTVAAFLYGRLQEFPIEWIGKFGSLDTPVTPPLLSLWIAGMATIVVVGLTSRRYQLILLSLSCLPLIVLMSLAMEYRWERASGLSLIQGRYVLPLVYVSLLLLALAAQEVPLARVRRMIWVVVALWAIAQPWALALSLYRNMFGVATSPLLQAASWHPPAPALLLLLLAGVGAAISAYSVGRIPPEQVTVIGEPIGDVGSPGEAQSGHLPGADQAGEDTAAGDGSTESSTPGHGGLQVLAEVP